MKRITALAAAVSVAALESVGAVAAPAKPDKPKQPTAIALPDGFQPEGIAAGRGGALYVGSIPTGAVLRIDPRTGATTTVVEGREGAAAIGLKVDRKDRLFVAGGPTGRAFVYDARTGDQLAEFHLAPAGEPTFVNDVTLTKRAAYFTDSQRMVLYVVPLKGSGFRELPLPDIPKVEGFNLNGIAATPNGRFLLAVQSASGALWRIDARTGDAVQVDLGGQALTNGDGLLLQGKRLYVVQNRDNRVAIVRLRERYTAGRITGALTSPAFDVPTTIARQGGSFFLPNARFGVEDPETASFDVVRVKAR